MAQRTIASPQPHLVAALHAADEDLIDALSRDGFAVTRATPEVAADVAVAEGAVALVADADVAGTLGAVARLRRRDEAVSAIPVVLIGQTNERSMAGIDAVEAGADVFLARPVAPSELTAKLHALLNTQDVPTDLPALGERVRHRGALRIPAAPPRAEPEGLSAPLVALLRAAVVESGGSDAGEIEIPTLGDENLDDLVPPELLEPLDAPLDGITEEPPVVPADATLPPLAPVNRRTPPVRAPLPPAQGSALAPLAVGGELRLSGSLDRWGVAQLFSAASRARATGVLALHTPTQAAHLSLRAGHLMTLRTLREEDHIGPLLVRLGFVPPEAARFAPAPLDAGPRGAALLAARGYVAPDGLALALARAAQEVLFDLLCVDAVEWELRPLDAATEIPLSPRALDALLVLGARARVEPVAAYHILGGDEARITLRSDPGALGALPLTSTERDAAAAARQTLVSSLVRSHGDAVLPALAALYWLQHLRAEGPALGPGLASAGPLGPERTRIRALAEAASRRDFLALLGVSEWATRLAAQAALDARRVELDALRARYPAMEVLPTLFAALDDLGQLLNEPGAWERYAGALRALGARTST